MAEAAADGEERADRRKNLAEARGRAPNADPNEIKARNQNALAARKARLANMKEAENTRPLPEGWSRVESHSRPGEFVYENVHTEERQAWFPEEAAEEEVHAPLVAQSEDDGRKTALKARNRAALEKRKATQAAQTAAEAQLDLPADWKRVESRSRPGEFVYENGVTGERQAWFPDGPADPGAEKRAEMMAKNRAALAKRRASRDAQTREEESRPLPPGWRRVESRSRPGEYVYENEFTEERQAWFPDEPAEKPLPQGWRKVESRTYPGEYVYENMYTLERQAWIPTEPAARTETQPQEASPAERTKQQLAALASSKPAPQRNIVCKAKATYDYTAVNREEEIDLLEGDVIAVEYKAANGWWVGVNTRTQRNGIFPGTYVEEIR